MHSSSGGSSYASLSRISTQVRRDVLRMVGDAGSGHVGGALGCADFFVLMYYLVMDYSVSSYTPQGDGEDVFLLSNGHICAGWYSVLAHRGYFPLSELGTFRGLGSRLQGHPSCEDGLPGIRISSGSLGQGLSVGIGFAEAKALKGDNHRVYVLMGDGEQQEGQVWEAAMYASHRKVKNLIVTIDCNGQQIDGKVGEVMSLGDLGAKYASFNWHVLHSDGHDMEGLHKKMQEACKVAKQGVPVVNLMRTEMGSGVSFMRNDYKWHGTPPSKAEMVSALGELEETLGDY